MEPEFLVLEAAKTMNKDALVKIFDLYAPALYKYSLRLCGDPSLADHIVGDVFAKLLEQFAAGRGPTSNLRSYLYEMAYHRIVDETRYSKRRTSLDALTSLPSHAGDTSQCAEDQILLKMIMHAIQHELTGDQRHVIVLRFLEEFSLRETAVILRKEVSHVKVIQGRALEKLRTVFRSQERRTMALPRARAISKSVGI